MIDELTQIIRTKADLKGFDNLDKAQKRAIKNNNILEKSFKRALGFLVSGVAIRSVIETSRKFDLLQKSLNGLTGGAENGARNFKFLRDEAYRTGNDLITIAGAYKNFYSAATGAGFNEKQIQFMFGGMLTAGRGIGASQRQMGGALLALEQMLSKGKVSMEELRRQLGNALPGAMGIARRAMGVTAQEFEEMMKKGISSAEFVPKFIQQATKELGKGFPEAVKSMDFALVNLMTAWQEFQVAIMKGKAGEEFTQFINELTGLLKSKEILTIAHGIGRTLTFIVKNLKIIVALFGFTKLVQLTMGIIKLHKSLIAMSTSTAVLGSVTRTLALSYAFISGGQVLKGFMLLGGAIRAMIAPSLAVAGIWSAIIAGVLILQDMLLTLTDKEAETYTRDLIKGATRSQFGSTGSPRALNIGEKMKQQQDLINGFNSNQPQIYSAPNLSSTRNNALSNIINLTINTPNGSPQAIQEATETALANVFNKYNMGYA